MSGQHLRFLDSPYMATCSKLTSIMEDCFSELSVIHFRARLKLKISYVFKKLEYPIAICVSLFTLVHNAFA